MYSTVVACSVMFCTYLFWFAFNFSCTVVHALYIGLRHAGAQRRQGVDAVRVRGLWQQVQAQGLAAAAHKVRV